MIQNIKNKIRNNKTLVSNIGYLGLFNLFSIISPLITLPYLLNILGKELYGIIVYSTAIVSYIIIFVNFGFNSPAVREISINRDNKKKISEIVSNVLFLKVIFFILSFGILYILSLYIPIIKEYKSLFYLTHIYMGINSCFFLSYYFQGVEKMKYQTFINIVVKLIFILLMFVFIKKEEDYLYIPILQIIGGIVATIISFYIIFVKEKINFVIPKIKILINRINEASVFFVNTVSITIYANTNKVIIGNFLGMTEVATYDIAEKILSLIKMIPGVINTAIFPKMSKEKNIIFIKKMFKMYLFIGVGIYFIFLVGADIIEKLVEYITKKEFYSLSGVIRVIFINVPFSFLNWFITLTLISYKKDKEVMYSVLLSSVGFLIIFAIYYILEVLNIYTITSIMALAEMILFVILSYIIWRKVKIKI